MCKCDGHVACSSTAEWLGLLGEEGALVDDLGLQGMGCEGLRAGYVCRQMRLPQFDVVLGLAASAKHIFVGYRQVFSPGCNEPTRRGLCSLRFACDVGPDCVCT